LPLLFPEMKMVAPRLVAHYFANAGNPEEGNLRDQAEAFIKGDRGFRPDRLKSLEPKFRQVIESGRANAVAVPESQSQRVLTILKSIDPGWHRVLKAGGLVLMVPGDPAMVLLSRPQADCLSRAIKGRSARFELCAHVLILRGLPSSHCIKPFTPKLSHPVAGQAKDQMKGHEKLSFRRSIYSKRSDDG
jgi:hypothetical protein